MCFACVRDVESKTAVVIGFGRGGQIQIGQRNLFRALRTKTPQGLSDDGIISDFLFVLIPEHQDSIGQNRRAFSLMLHRARLRAGVLILIPVGILLLHHLLLPHLLFIEALLVHVVGDSAILLIAVVVCCKRAVIGQNRKSQQPVGIVIAVQARRVIAVAATGVTVAVIAESDGGAEDLKVVWVLSDLRLEIGGREKGRGVASR